MLIVSRWSFVLCSHLPRSQGTPDRQPEDPVNCCDHLGWHDVRGIQLLAEHFQDQERRLPLLPPSVLDTLTVINVRDLWLTGLLKSKIFAANKR